MSIITIDVNIQKINLLVRQLDQIASGQTFATRPVKRKPKTDLSFSSTSKQEVTLGSKRKKRDISQTKKLY